MRFSREEYWSGFPYPLSGNLPDPGIEPTSLVSVALASRFFLSLGTPGTSCKLIAESPKKVFSIAPLWSYFFSLISSAATAQLLRRVQLFATPWITHSRPRCSSPTPGVHPNSCPSSQWCHPAISSSVVPFFSCPQSFQASESFPMSQLFAWGHQSTGVSALASFLPKKS